MGNGKKIKRPKRTKLWKVLNGTYKKTTKIQREVERLIKAIQQDIVWDDKDIATFQKIQTGKIF